MGGGIGREGLGKVVNGMEEYYGGGEVGGGTKWRTDIILRIFLASLIRKEFGPSNFLPETRRLRNCPLFRNAEPYPFPQPQGTRITRENFSFFLIDLKLLRENYGQPFSNFRSVVSYYTTFTGVFYVRGAATKTFSRF